MRGPTGPAERRTSPVAGTNRRPAPPKSLPGVAGFKSEWWTGFRPEGWPTSNRKGWPACVGICTDQKPGGNAGLENFFGQ